MAIFLAELIGTILLVLLGNGSVANVLLRRSKGEKGGWIVISTGWGFAVAVAVYTVFWISGGHINPAVTLGLCYAGRTSWDLAPYYFSGQLLGGFVGGILVWLSYFPHWKVTEDKTKKLLCFATKPAIRNLVWNLATEIIATAVLLIAVMAIFDPSKPVNPSIAPYIVGLVVFSIGVSLGGSTGYAINPARDLGPRVVHAIFPISGKGDSDWSYAWVPVLGPAIGALLGVFIYQLTIDRFYALAY